MTRSIIFTSTSHKLIYPKRDLIHRHFSIKSRTRRAAADNAENKELQPHRRTRKRKSSNKTRLKRASASQRYTWLKVLLSLFWKSSVALLAVLIFIGIYLDSVVKERFNGQLFELPTVVYARVKQIVPGDSITISQMRYELDALNYRKVDQPHHAGEYSSSSSKIELIRRPFEFVDGPEPDRHVMLHFDDSGLVRIQSLVQGRDLGYLRIDPQMLGMLEKESDQQRLFLKRSQFPEVMVDALLATEDRHFYQHDGVSPFAILRAFIVNFKAGRTVQGGSTLTQQLAKNLFLSQDRTLWRKMREAYIALIIDHRYSKDRILEAYLNEVYLGQNGSDAIHGFGLAARFYFGQPIDELRIDQLALLVGMVKGPSYYNPIRYPDRALERRDLVLRLMMQQNILTASQYESAASRALDIQSKPHVSSLQPAYFEQVRRELRTHVGGHFTADKGLRVFTSLDPVSQMALEQAISTTLPNLEKNASSALEAAAIAVDRQSGEIRAMVGGKRVGFDGFNRVLNGSRPIGSLAKPAVYLTALLQPDRYSLATTLNDEALTLKDKAGKSWSPRNFDRRYRGNVPLYKSLAMSLNIPTVRLGTEVGLSAVIDTLVKLGIDRNEIRPLPSMLLGAYSLTPYQVAQMYQTIGNTGKRASLTALQSVMDLNGEVLYQSIPKVMQAVDQQAAWLTVYAMKRGVAEGTGRALQKEFAWAALAGKTGTSNDSRDSWFVGIDGQEVTTIWVGKDNNDPTKLTGASGALKVYHHYLTARIPEHLTLTWPEQIRTFSFSTQPNGSLLLDCSNSSAVKLPIWDKNKRLETKCKEAEKPWFEKMFAW